MVNAADDLQTGWLPAGNSGTLMLCLKTISQAPIYHISYQSHWQKMLVKKVQLNKEISKSSEENAGYFYSMMSWLNFLIVQKLPVIN
jgi:uncharacterized membrane protein